MAAPTRRLEAPPAIAVRGRGGDLRGHLWTVGGLLRRQIARPAAPAAARFAASVEDPVTGRQPVRGLLSAAAEDRGLLVLVHGLGGSADSTYMRMLAAAARRLGLASLRLSLRGAGGAGGDGADFYHAGLTADLHAALADRSLRRFERVLVAGLSLGGHVALRYATEAGDPRLAAVAAVSAPLDLDAGARAIDRRPMAAYRRYLLRGLVPHGERAWEAGYLATPPERLRRVRRLREWDGLTVAPRFGFRDAADYYARAGVGGRLGALRCPALLLAAEDDPMVPPAAIHPAVAAVRTPGLTVHWCRSGGHLAFPATLDLGAGGALGFAAQVPGWLALHHR